MSFRAKRGILVIPAERTALYKESKDSSCAHYVGTRLRSLGMTITIGGET
jgi:hypothetical protein